MTDMTEIALRFTSERERIGYSLSALARFLEISAEGLRKIENGKSVFKVDILFSCAKLGMDINYIVTGNRTEDRKTLENNIVNPQVNNIGTVKNGGTVINSTGGEVNINPRKITKAITNPGNEHISVEQRATLKALVEDIVELESKLKKDPKSHRAVWSALNAHCSVNTYTLILSDDFVKARKYLDTWIGRLNSSASAPIKDGDNWKKRHYAYIKVNTKNQEDAAALDAYMARNFKASSLTELSNDDLEKVYRYIAGRRNKRK